VTYPGFQAHQAQQAESTRVAQHATHAGLDLNRRYQRARTARGTSAPSARGPGSAAIRMIGRLIQFVVRLAILGAALGVLALVLEQADPSLYHQAVTWFKHLL
jgi:hypothetical protein